MISGMADARSSSRFDRFFRGSDGANWGRIAIAALALLYGILFIVLNRGKVRVHFVFFTVTTRLWVGLLVCGILGLLLGQAIGAYQRRSGRPAPPRRDEAA
jgi:uncharacterized integral membrane protein